jgi:hypothetical protein
VVALNFYFTGVSLGVEKRLIDNFNSENNLLGARNNVYQREPSRIIFRKIEMERAGKKDKVLMLKYDKKAEGGPYGKGGWCGYYTLLNVSDEYFDGHKYEKLTLWVKGETGEENFVVGLADDYWQQIGDSLKSEEIGKYLPAGKLTTQWQKAEIPLGSFFLDLKKLASIAICFEGELFGGEEARGTVYIDDIAFE